MTLRKDMKGLRFGRLLVIEEGPRHPITRRVLWNCKCDCGNTKLADGVYLRSGHVKSCGCLVKDLVSERSKKKDSGLNLLFRNYKRSAKTRGYEFELSLEYFNTITKENCFYCGCHPYKIATKLSKYGAYTYNGIDRLDNNTGYVYSNCVACCESCNFLKRSLNHNEFVDKIKLIYANLQEKN